MPKSAQRTAEKQPGKMPAVVPQASAQTAFHRCEVMSTAINILRPTCQIFLEFSSENKPCVNVKGGKRKNRKILVLWVDPVNLLSLSMMSTDCYLHLLLQAH